MGNRIRVQRRGRGTPTFRASTHKRVAPATYPPAGITAKGLIKGLFHDPGRGAPLMLVELERGMDFYALPPEGVSEGQIIEVGSSNSKVGNIMYLGAIPEGTTICNIERTASDGGKFARSSGSFATIFGHTQDGTVIELPSGRRVLLSDNCRATIGAVAGSGRVEKPFLKAGNKYHLMNSKGRVYPRTRGVAMIAAAHPFGTGRRRGPKKPTSVRRSAPPGKKVGLIAPRRTGRKRGGKRREQRV